MAWPEDDNRQHARFPYVRPVRYTPLKIVGRPAEAEAVPRGEIMDISNGGMGIRIERPTVEMGAMVMAWVPIDEFPVTIPVPSVVTRVNKESPGLYHLGLRFLL